MEYKSKQRCQQNLRSWKPWSLWCILVYVDGGRSVEEAGLKLENTAFRIVALFAYFKCFWARSVFHYVEEIATDTFQEPESETLAQRSIIYTTVIWLSHFGWREDSFWQREERYFHHHFPLGLRMALMTSRKIWGKAKKVHFWVTFTVLASYPVVYISGKPFVWACVTVSYGEGRTSLCLSLTENNLGFLNVENTCWKFIADRAIFYKKTQKIINILRYLKPEISPPNVCV